MLILLALLIISAILFQPLFGMELCFKAQQPISKEYMLGRAFISKSRRACEMIRVRAPPMGLPGTYRLVSGNACINVTRFVL